MKKIIALLTLFALVLTFAACGKADGKDGGSDSADENGVPMPTLDGRDEMTIDMELTVGDANFPQTVSFRQAGDYRLYYIVSAQGVEQYHIEGTEGVKSYVRTDGRGEFVVSEYVEGTSFTSPLSTFGFEADKYFDSISGKKAGEEKIGEYDCDIYDIEYTEAGEKISSRVWIDRESSLWVKSNITDTNGAKLTFDVKGITDECADMPGTIPVSVTPGQVYSQDGLTLNLKGIEFDPTYAATLKMEAVNATDSALKVGSKFFDVNGLCIGGNVFAVSVPAGGSLDFDINIPSKSCDIADIKMIEEMEFAISAQKYHTEQDGEGTYDVSDGMLIEYSVPVKITATCPVELPEKEVGERRLLCKAEGFTAYFGGVRENVSGGYDFVVYYESEFNEDIRLTVNIHEVNGKAYDDFEKVYLYSMRKGFGGFSLWSDKVTEKPTEIKLSFEAYCGELYNGTCILEETEPFVLMLK